MNLTRRPVLGCALAALAWPSWVLPNDGVVVFAAASLTNVLQTLAARLAPGGVRFSFAASSTLARQIEQGAPAHVFVSADEAWMDYLAERGRVEAATRRVLAGNRLVVVRPAMAGSAPVPPPESLDALRAALQPAAGSHAPQRVATGDPSHVPAGRYAQAALTRLGLWAQVEPRLVRADSVRTALSYVERGEVAAGIVYATDAPIARGVQVVARFPAASHSPIRYPAALVAGAPPAARAFLDVLASPAALALWQAAGFDLP